MFSRLKTAFPSLIPFTWEESERERYIWFVMEDDEIIGIDKSELSERDFSVLSAFLTPYREKFPMPTDEEKKWTDAIQGRQTLDWKSSYRFIHFHILTRHVEPKAVDQALREAVDRKVKIIWKNAHEGIIIEEIEQAKETIKFGEIIDLIMSDLYLNIKLYVAPPNYDAMSPTTYHDRTSEQARLLFNTLGQSVISFTDGMTDLILDRTSQEDKQNIISVLGDYADDPAWLEAMTVLFKSSLNISVASKKLFMHRNTLLYKMDKFSENTGLDLRNFDDAVKVQLAIRCLNMEKCTK